MEKQEERKSSLLDGWDTPPNLVTFSRIILVIVFLALYAKAGARGVDINRLLKQYEMMQKMMKKVKRNPKGFMRSLGSLGGRGGGFRGFGR